MSSLVICSGGMDSVTLAYILAQTDTVSLLTFDYAQRHKIEIDCARAAAQALGAQHIILDIRDLGRWLPGNALTQQAVRVPHGHYSSATMLSTVVPNRNAIFLSIAFGIAAANGFEVVAIGVHAGDHPLYPDCRPEFISSFEAMECAALGKKRPLDTPRLCTPLLFETKADIVRFGHKLGVPFEHTWSCYEGGEVHCGECGTCLERREAFKMAGIPDPTRYRVSAGEP